MPVYVRVGVSGERELGARYLPSLADANLREWLARLARLEWLGWVGITRGAKGGTPGTQWRAQGLPRRTRNRMNAERCLSRADVTR